MWVAKPSAVRNHAIAVARPRFAEVEVARDRSGQGRAVDDGGADLREFWAVRFFLGAKAGFRVGADGLPVRSVGVDRKAFRESHRRRFDLRGDGVSALENCGTLKLTLRPLAESVSVVVGSAERLGLKLSWSQPVIAGYSPWSFRFRGRRRSFRIRSSAGPSKRSGLRGRGFRAGRRVRPDVEPPAFRKRRPFVPLEVRARSPTSSAHWWAPPWPTKPTEARREWARRALPRGTGRRQRWCSRAEAPWSLPVGRSRSRCGR